MKTLFSFLFVSVSFITTIQSQHRVLLKDGSSIPFKRKSHKSASLVIITTDKEKVEIDTVKLIGFVDDKMFQTHHIMPINPSFQFVEARLEGSINLYIDIDRSVVVTGRSQGDVSWYLKDNGGYHLVYTRAILNDKKGYREILSKFVANDDMALKMVNSQDFIINFETVHDLINTYNVNKHKKVTARDLKNQANVAFYSKVKGKDGGLSLTVNDSTSYNIPENKLALIPLTVDVPSKVCLSSGADKYCTTMKASKFGTKNFEAFYNANSKKFEISQKSEIETKNQLSLAGMRN